MRLITLPVTTSALGAFSDTLHSVSGCLQWVRYVPHGTSPLDTGADIDLVGAKTGLVLINHDDIGTSAFTRAYRHATHDVDGSAALYAATGEAVLTKISVYGEDLTFTVANGGNALSGTFYFLFG